MSYQVNGLVSPRLPEDKSVLILVLRYQHLFILLIPNKQRLNTFMMVYHGVHVKWPEDKPNKNL